MPLWSSSLFLDNNMHAISMKLFNSKCRGAICESGVFSHNCNPFAAMNPCTNLIILNFVSSGSSAHVHKNQWIIGGATHTENWWSLLGEWLVDWFIKIVQDFDQSIQIKTRIKFTEWNRHSKIDNHSWSLNLLAYVCEEKKKNNS